MFKSIDCTHYAVLKWASVMIVTSCYYSKLHVHVFSLAAKHKKRIIHRLVCTCTLMSTDLFNLGYYYQDLLRIYHFLFSSLSYVHVHVDQE